ncbi:RNA polymerase sigma factor [Streptococcus sp. ZJ151]|uniref:RNA polymerase sigma factor n=1 Tax=Streptococcus jiangjianxini TaxID=3161189 RepID=UPI0032EDEDF2
MKLDDYEQSLVEIAKEISFYLQKGGASKADADDISQDLFVKLLESDIDLPFSKLRAWMYRTAIRKYIDSYRRHVTYQAILQKEFFTEAATLTPFDQEDTSDLEDILKQLPEVYFLVIDLFYFQDFSIKEISRLLGVRQATVKMRLSRARKQIKKLIEKEGKTYEFTKPL